MVLGGTAYRGIGGVMMKATDGRYHVGLGLLLDGKFSFDRTATLADLWAILIHAFLRHPLKTTILSRRYSQ
jgi:hypothetical protein